MREIATRLTECANGVTDEHGRFFPFKHITLSSANQDWTPPGKGRIYVKSGFILVRQVAGDTATYCTVNGESLDNGYVDSMLYLDFVAGQQLIPMIHVRENINLLLDYGSGVTLVMDGTASSYWASLTLAVIDYG